MGWSSRALSLKGPCPTLADRVQFLFVAMGRDGQVRRLARTRHGPSLTLQEPTLRESGFALRWDGMGGPGELQQRSQQHIVTNSSSSLASVCAAQVASLRCMSLPASAACCCSSAVALLPLLACCYSTYCSAPPSSPCLRVPPPAVSDSDFLKDQGILNGDANMAPSIIQAQDNLLKSVAADKVNRGDGIPCCRVSCWLCSCWPLVSHAGFGGWLFVSCWALLALVAGCSSGAGSSCWLLVSCWL
jgi:hypothetical protein